MTKKTVYEDLMRTLLELLQECDSCSARELLKRYRERTDDISRSRPRMALLELIGSGKVKWGDKGEVTLVAESTEEELVEN